MHDPEVVAFDIPRPWPRRSKINDAKPGRARWNARYHHDCSKYGCTERHAGRRFFPWWRISSYSSTWVIAGRGYYFPALVTVWHVEPGGKDSGEVCKRYTRVRQPDGTYETKVTNAWRWHVHHWRIQLPALQALRRRLLTRCEWCGGPSRKGDLVNHNLQWGQEKTPWWRGEPGMYHWDCVAYKSASTECLCSSPDTGERGAYGKCSRCEKPASGKLTPGDLVRRRLLASVPRGHRNRKLWDRIATAAQEEKSD